MTLKMPPVVMTESRYRVLIRGLSRMQQDALAHLIEFGNIGPANWRTIEALQSRELIEEKMGSYQTTALGKMVAHYIESHKTATPSKGWQVKSNT